MAPAPTVLPGTTFRSRRPVSGSARSGHVDAGLLHASLPGLGRHSRRATRRGLVLHPVDGADFIHQLGQRREVEVPFQTAGNRHRVQPGVDQPVIGKFQQLPDRIDHRHAVRVDDQSIVFNVMACDVHVAGALQRQLPHVFVGVEAVVAAVHVDVVHIQVQQAARFLHHLAHEGGVIHLGTFRRRIVAGILDADLLAHVVLHLGDALGHMTHRLVRGRQRQQVVELPFVPAPRQVFGIEGDPVGPHEAFTSARSRMSRPSLPPRFNDRPWQASDRCSLIADKSREKRPPSRLQFSGATSKKATTSIVPASSMASVSASRLRRRPSPARCSNRTSRESLVMTPSPLFMPHPSPGATRPAASIVGSLTQGRTIRNTPGPRRA